MELPAEVMIHSALVGAKGGKGTLLQVNPDGSTNFALEKVGTVRPRDTEDTNTFRATRDLTLGLSGTYLDVSILSYPFGQCYPLQTLAQGCVGSRVSRPSRKMKHDGR